MFAAFVLWTLTVCFVDVQAIGPQQTAVGLASLNSMVHKLTGVHMTLYTITDWLGLVPVFCAIGCAALGLAQWINRKSITKVDHSLLLLGAFYIIVFGAYFFFEKHVVNYRPVLISGNLEASYPSSTTLLVLCIMPTTIMQLKSRIKKKSLRNLLCIMISAFSVFMVICRLVSGVHWLSDIIGGVLLSAALVLMYYSACRFTEK